MRYGEEQSLPVELIDVYSDTDFSLTGLQADGTFSAVSDNLTIGLSEKHALLIQIIIVLITPLYLL